MSDENEQKPEKQKITVTQLLLSGDDRQYIFAEVLDDEGDDLIVRHPMALNLVRSRDGEGFGIILHDYMPFAQDRIVSNNRGMIKASCRPHRDMAIYYLKYRDRCEEEKMEETMIARVTEGLEEELYPRTLDESPAGESDTKH
jgi:hypothetical protein